jgi:uncharacterized Tic20 family protein
MEENANIPVEEAEVLATPGEEAPQRELTQDEKTMAALAHGSIVLGLVSGGVGGIIAALVIWIAYKEKSAYVAFQSLQAMIFQGLTLVSAFLVGVVWTFVGLLSAIIIGLFLIPLAIAISFVPVVLFFYGLYAAYETYEGRDFQYWLLADVLKKQAA